MDTVISDFSDRSAKAIANLKDELKTIRTGRASPSLVENLIVEAYGGQTKMRLMELASIAIESPTALLIIPFDPSTISDIEKAILKSPLGISPIVQGNRIIVRIPPLSQEQREKMKKLVGVQVEERKVVIRHYRDDARKEIKTKLEAKEITEDNKFRLEKEIDNITQKLMEEIQTIKENKEKEIMAV